jgi:hypothetical protein
MTRLEKFREMHRLIHEPQGTVLYIGAEKYRRGSSWSAVQ